MNTKFLNTLYSIVKFYNLKINPGSNAMVYKSLSKNIEVLIFNVISIAAIISLINNSQTIQKEAVKMVRDYIHDKCNTHQMKKGGTSLPSDYFGVANSSYNVNNNTNDILGIDFASGIARTQIGGGGSTRKSYKLSKSDTDEFINVIKNICKYYNLKISSEVIKMLIDIIVENMDCLFNYLYMASKPITTDLIKKMIKLNKKFDIFK
jgi:hypothetical protein